MNAQRVFLLLIIILGVLIVGLGVSAYGISSLVKMKSDQLAVSKGENQQLSSEQAGLAKSKKEIVEYAQLEAITKTIVPQDKDQAEAVREITNIANTTDVTLTSITFPNSTLGTAPPTATGSTATTPAATPKSVLTQLTPVPKIPGVYDLQITVTNNASNPVSFNQLDNFLKGLENNRRTAEVSSISIQPQANKPDQLVFSLILNDYIKP